MIGKAGRREGGVGWGSGGLIKQCVPGIGDWCGGQGRRGKRGPKLRVFGFLKNVAGTFTWLAIYQSKGLVLGYPWVFTAPL